ncbi:BrnA antitoxin family protein [Brenneria corticis]|uniref:Cytoplasmic protein n=1 Tax=Brenneria corticis TaxID=2173106 RepID=A0A2U1U551_9GAMM|nr:BrnA antitoxin family protein [Brenneria sp. CFCC 11842]PWC16704.1 cytoplasmic protein [Brenneria sp. CFCC 11842]
MSKTVRYRVDLANLPPLTETQRAELEELATRPDREIDYSDIPPLAETFWRNAVSNPFYKPTKQATTVRLDTDILAWLKAPGKGYQTRINAILREAMLRDLDQHRG